MKTHRFDPLSFVSGALAAAIGLVFLVPAEPDDLFGHLVDVGSWFWPAVLIAVGVAVLAPLIVRRNPESGESQED